MYVYTEPLNIFSVSKFYTSLSQNYMTYAILLHRLH